MTRDTAWGIILVSSAFIFVNLLKRTTAPLCFTASYLDLRLKQKKRRTRREIRRVKWCRDEKKHRRKEKNQKDPYIEFRIKQPEKYKFCYDSALIYLAIQCVAQE